MAHVFIVSLFSIVNRNTFLLLLFLFYYESKPDVDIKSVIRFDVPSATSFSTLTVMY